jgi:hypothetical protein
MVGYDTAFGYMCIASMLMIPMVLLMRTPRIVDIDPYMRDTGAH